MLLGGRKWRKRILRWRSEWSEWMELYVGILDALVHYIRCLGGAGLWGGVWCLISAPCSAR